MAQADRCTAAGKGISRMHQDLAVGCGEYPDVETAAAKIVKVVDTVIPEPELTRKYEERYQYFRRIYPTVKELF